MFDVEKFRKQLEDRLAEVEQERSKAGNSEKFNHETDGYIRCLKNILFNLPPKGAI